MRPDETGGEDDEIRIGISACLLGEKVRFDGGHKRDRFLTDTLATMVRFVSVCPELEMGLGVPRPTLRLERPSADSDHRLIEPSTGRDLTAPMERFSRRRARELEQLDLSGYVLKKDSPSCGLLRVRVYDWNGAPAKIGAGVFARVLAERMPHLPMEEEGRLCDPRLRENFFERVFAWRRLKQLFRGRWKVGDLVRFHTAEKLLLLAHHEPAYRRLGRLVADAARQPRAEVASRYRAEFMEALAHKATARRHTNVLQHATGYFKELASPGDREELREVIGDYHRGLVPLVVPVTLIRHLVRRHDVDYLAGQTYLEPHPRELMLRNHV